MCAVRARTQISARRLKKQQHIFTVVGFVINFPNTVGFVCVCVYVGGAGGGGGGNFFLFFSGCGGEGFLCCCCCWILF